MIQRRSESRDVERKLYRWLRSAAPLGVSRLPSACVKEARTMVMGGSATQDRRGRLIEMKVPQVNDLIDGTDRCEWWYALPV